MSWLEAIPLIGDLFKGTTDIIKEVVVDKDAQNKILESLDILRMTVAKEVYVAELNTKTIPWIDAVHKMGRQILNASTMGIVFVLLMYDKEITGPVALILGGGNAVYQFVKGKGK